jgi:phosphoribosylaminoimidazolecarboxamide formyltransferase / IMP cyclohydrolase
MKRYALISVFDKTGVVDLAKTLEAQEIHIIATGKTAELLEKNSINVIPIEKITQAPESFEGRMKTISFQIASGILFNRKKNLHINQAIELNIPSIDYVICNFYPFWEKPEIEMIDIGGPTMVRAAAKNFESVTVIIDPLDYKKVIQEITQKSETSQELRKTLAAKAFSYVAEYDNLIANYFQKETNNQDIYLRLRNGKRLRYGENPHQQGTFFKEKTRDELGLGKFTLLQGKETSYNNYLDIDAGLQTMALIGQDSPTCVILKHANPCGVAVAETIEDAFKKAWYDGDSLAAFGGIIILNRPVTDKLAEIMFADKKFFEIVVAPEFSEEAKELFITKPKLQLLENKQLRKPFINDYHDVKKVRGGFLVQDSDTNQLDEKKMQIVTKKKPTEQQMKDLLFAWKICQTSKSNCVVVVKNNVLLASGVGQQDRKRCCELCVNKATTSLKDAVAATDGFFPFRDGPDVLIKAGITAIIQPGGSIRDQETIDACDEAGITMICTGIRAFKH